MWYNMLQSTVDNMQVDSRLDLRTLGLFNISG